jgi:hypothetical protein
LFLASARLVVIGIAVLPFAFEANGQERGAELRGIVRDQQGIVLVGATITARNRASGLTRSTVTDDTGQYRLIALMPGEYDVTAEAAGFSTTGVEALRLMIGIDVRQDFQLPLAAVRETLTVSARDPLVDVGNSEISGVVNEEQIAALPIPSRNYLALALLMPGTSQDASRSFFESVNVGASMTFNTTLNVVDGVINNWAEDGEPRQDIPQDAVRELRVNESQYPATYGLATGGMVQVVTRSGTNQFESSVFEYFGDKELNATGVFETEKPNYRRHQFGASTGGPLVRNRTHYFAAFERTDLNDYYTITTGKPEFYSSMEGTFVRPGFTNLYFGRLDHQMGPHLVFVRYGQEDAVRRCQGCGGTGVRSGWDQDIPRKSLVAGHSWIASARWVNESRLQFANGTYRLAPPGTEFWKAPGEYPDERLAMQQPAYRFPSLAYGSAADLQGPESRFEIRNTTTWQTASHDLRFGGEFSHMPYSNDRAFLYGGIWIFDRDQYFNPNDPASIAALDSPILYLSIRPPLLVKRPSSYGAVFVHDVWKLRPNLTLNAGLRYEQVRGPMNEDLDVSTLPGDLPALYAELGLDPGTRRDRNNVGPRAGIAWDVIGDGATSVRAGYGLYYNHVRLLGNSFELINLRQYNIVIPNPTYPDPYGGRDPLEFASTAPPDVSVVANHYVQPYSHQFNAGVSRELGAGAAVHIDALYSRARHDRKVVDINHTDPVTGLRPYPAWGHIDKYLSIARGSYRAMYARVEKRMRAGSQVQFAYTLAKSDDDNPLERFANSADPDADYGPSNADRRHAIVANGVFMLPADIMIGGVWTFRSELPFNAIAGRDLNNDGYLMDYVPGTTRNQGARNLDLRLVDAWRAEFGLPAVSADQIDSTLFSSIDVRAGKSFGLPGRARLEAFLQVFNLTNRTNLLALYTEGRVTNALSDSFGRILTARDKRRAEIVVRAWF